MHCTDGTLIQAGRHWSGVYGTARCMPVRSEEISEPRPSFQRNKKRYGSNEQQSDAPCGASVDPLW